jgi:hypothetical protein
MRSRLVFFTFVKPEKETKDAELAGRPDFDMAKY